MIGLLKELKRMLGYISGIVLIPLIFSLGPAWLWVIILGVSLCTMIGFKWFIRFGQYK